MDPTRTMNLKAVNRQSVESRQRRSLFTLHSSLSAFTLTEVVLSIAIVAVAVVGVMTAFPVGMRAGREARDDTVLAMIAQDVFARIRSQPFTSCWVQRMGSFWRGSLGGYPNGAWVTWNEQQIFYYSADGRPANESSKPSNIGEPPDKDDPYKPDEGYYGLRIMFVSNPYGNYGGSGGPASQLQSFGNNVTKVYLDFSYPARNSIAPDRRNHKVFMTLVGNMQ